jgi:hypothetical protein
VIIEGQYRSDPILCPNCRQQFRCGACGIQAFDQHEKMTDVNIATHMLVDAMKDRMDDAILVTGDSDQRPTVDAMRKVFGKPVYVVFPPMRFSADLKSHADDGRMALEKATERVNSPTWLTCPVATRSLSPIDGGRSRYGRSSSFRPTPVTALEVLPHPPGSCPVRITMPLRFTARWDEPGSCAAGAPNLVRSGRKQR